MTSILKAKLRARLCPANCQATGQAGCEHRVLSAFLLRGCQEQILELHHERRPGVNLQREDALLRTLRGLIRHIHGLLAIDEMLQVTAFGDDPVFVPVGLFDGCLDFVCVAERSRDFDFELLRIFALLDDDLLAALGEDAAAFFLVEDAAVALATSKSAW